MAKASLTFVLVSLALLFAEAARQHSESSGDGRLEMADQQHEQDTGGGRRRPHPKKKPKEKKLLCPENCAQYGCIGSFKGSRCETYDKEECTSKEHKGKKVCTWLE